MKNHIGKPVAGKYMGRGKKSKLVCVGCIAAPAVILAWGLMAVVPGKTGRALTSTVETQTINLSDALYQLQETGLGMEPLVSSINITDNYAVTVKCDGDTRTIFTEETTVGGVLEQMDITLDTYDTVNLDLDSPIAEGTLVKVSRAEIYYETEYTDIPYETVRTEDPNMEEGTEVVTQEGKNGTSFAYYQVVVRDDEEPEYILLDSGIQTEPVTEEITYGTYIPNTLITASGERVYYSQVLTCTATAYTDYSGQPTATGTTPRVGAIAVDPSVIPYGTKMYIVTTDGSVVYGYATAEDCGGAIKGNRVDLYYNTESECIQFGRRSVLVYILED